MKRPKDENREKMSNRPSNSCLLRGTVTQTHSNSSSSQNNLLISLPREQNRYVKNARYHNSNPLRPPPPKRPLNEPPNKRSNSCSKRRYRVVYPQTRTAIPRRTVIHDRGGRIIHIRRCKHARKESTNR